MRYVTIDRKMKSKHNQKDFIQLRAQIAPVQVEVNKEDHNHPSTHDKHRVAQSDYPKQDDDELKLT
jgi:hypothetical protein